MRSGGPRQEHFSHSIMDTLYSRTAVIPATVSIGLLHDHRRVRLKQKNLASLIETEVDAAIVEAERRLHLVERSHCLVPQHARHIGQEFRFFGAVFDAICHVGAEVVDLPVLRDGQMERIKLSVDHHHAVLPSASVRTSRIEICDRQHFILRPSRPREASHCGSEFRLGLDLAKMLSHVEAWRPQEKWEGEASRGKCVCSIRSSQKLMAEQ